MYPANELCTKNQGKLKTIKTMYKLQLRKIKNCLSTQWPELALRLNEQVVVAAVVPLNMEIKYSLVVKTFATRAHQRQQPEMMQQGVKNQPCHQHEVLVAGLTFLKEIHCLHGPVPDVLTPMSVLKPVSSNLTTVQTNQVQGM